MHPVIEIIIHEVEPGRKRYWASMHPTHIPKTFSLPTVLPLLSLKCIQIKLEKGKCGIWIVKPEVCLMKRISPQIH